MITNMCDKEMQMPQMSKYMETYIRLASDRVMFLSENVTKDVASQISALLLYYDNTEPGVDIYMYIHCNGGDAAGLANIYDVMTMIKSPIRTVCMGKAYSAGAILLAAGTKGKRYAFKNSSIMIHGMQCLFPIAGQDQCNAKNYYEFLKNNNDGILKILAKHTGKTLNQIRQDCSRDLFLNSKQALEYGLIDAIL